MKIKLPQPSYLAAAHSQTVATFIGDHIKQQGPITFAEYMNLALYAPGLGYYDVGTEKLGKTGDFVTAPEISPLYSRAIAHQCAQVLAGCQRGNILELGPGTAVMAADILLELERLRQLPEHYLLLEVSADLRQRQQQTLARQIPHLLSRVKWLDCLPSAMEGVILANEVIDAMPVHRFLLDVDIYEYYVDIKTGINSNNNDKIDHNIIDRNITQAEKSQIEHFIWCIDKPTPKLRQTVDRLTIPQNSNYSSEINLLLEGWIAGLAPIITKGIMLFIDYGFPQHEYYHPQRHMGTLMCHYQHHAYDNPLLFPGIQDITAHVDFSLVRLAAEKVGLDLAGYTNQASFLVNCGIVNFLDEVNNDESQFRRYSQQIKQLTMPTEMGELFKVIALAKNFTIPLLGFHWHDMREKLYEKF